MRLIEISAERDEIVFSLDENYNGRISLREEVPLIHGSPETVDETTLCFTEGKASLPRQIGEHDLLGHRFRDG